MDDVINDKAWLEKMMYIFRINQWDNRFGTSNYIYIYIYIDWTSKKEKTLV